MFSFIHGLASDLQLRQTRLDPWDNLHLFIQDAIPPIINFRPDTRFLKHCDRDPETAAPLLCVEANSIRKLKGVQLAPRLVKRSPLIFCNGYIPKTESDLTADDLPPLSRFEGLLSTQFSTTIDPKLAQKKEASIMEDVGIAMSPTVIAATTALWMVWPEETKDHSVIRIRETYGEKLFTVMSYRKKIDEHSLEVTHKLMIFCFAAWGLSCSDFHDFLAIGDNFPTHVMGEAKPQYNKSQRVWAKVWDMCAQRRCPFFVVTNNESWVFGWFIAGWTKAIVSGVVKRENKSPSVLQCLVYWLASAMEIGGALRRPVKGLSATGGNLDINDHTKIMEEKPKYMTHADWLEHYLTAERASDSAFLTVAHPEHSNVWITGPRQDNV